MCVSPICLFSQLVTFAPVLVAIVTTRRIRRADVAYTLALLAFVVSIPGEVLRILGYAWGLEWAASHLYPGVQIGLFAMALAGVVPGLVTAFVVYMLASGELFIGGLADPSFLPKIIGGWIVGLLAVRKWGHPLAPTAFVYCFVGAIAWCLWYPYMREYSTANTVTYLIYQTTRLVAMGLFIWAAYRRREA